VLAARGLPVAPDVRQRIAACTDATVIGRCLALAATATDGAAFADGVGPLLAG
jgi:hypothetical protein